MDWDKKYNFVFYRRALICFILCIVLFFVSILRVATVATKDYTQVATIKNGLRLTISKSRGTIYDCNNAPLTNDCEKIIAAVSPTPRAITAISQVLKGDVLENVLERLKSNKPVLCEVPEAIECDGIICTKVYETTQNTAIHMLGYTDNTGKGVSGLQKAYDDILYCETDVSIYYETDGKGRILEGINPVLTNPYFAAANGIVTTLDINIQNIAEEHSKNLEKGAIIVADVKNGEIRACVSRPDFDINNISKYLNSENSPLLNRAINAYNVGSIFKPCVAIAGIESGKQDFNYNCTGSCEIIDRYFKCHKQDGHGSLNLNSAIAFSCNTFFYNYAFQIGEDTILTTAKKLSFGQSLKICDGIYTAKGELPQLNNLSNIAHLANFSIGQGQLLLSPISIITLYQAIANNGKYYIPNIIKGTVKNGNFTEYTKGSPTKVMERTTAEILKNYLQSVLSEGTGASAKPQTVTAAGKTATAQTGKFKNGREICQGWFCGFFPAENPQYVIVVFSEDDSKQSLTCAEIFAKIADDINSYIKSPTF